MRKSWIEKPTANTTVTTLFSMLMIGILFSGCYAPGSYRVGKTGVGSNGILVLMQFAQKHPYVIIHDGDSAWQLSNYQVNDQYTTLTGNLKELPPQRLTYKKVDVRKTNIAPPENKYPFDEMHVKVSGIKPDTAAQVTLTYENVDEIQLYNKINSNSGKAPLAAGIGISVALIVVGIIVVIGTLVALIQEISKDILD